MIQKDKYNILRDECGHHLRGKFRVYPTILRMLARILKNQRRIERKIDEVNSKLPEPLLG